MIIKYLGIQPYEKVWQEMREFTQNRDTNTEDEIWLLEHYPVYTQGQAGKKEHILLNTQDIPIIQTDRGGQVTYHGPGQLVCYILMNITLKKIGIRTLVTNLEQVLINMLKQAYNIDAKRQHKAPGVYVDEKKIASIGLRVKNGCTYHGIALNVSLDIKPFLNINPCGYANLKMTKITDYCHNVTVEDASQEFIKHFNEIFTCTYLSIT